MRKPKPRLLKPTHPNVGLESEYRRRLTSLLEEMAGSVEYWLALAYRKAPPLAALAADELPARALQRQLRLLSKRWLLKFDDMATKLAAMWVHKVETASSTATKHAFRQAGFAVEFRMTKAMRDVAEATVQANVGLIKSIPRQYLGQVEGIVMRGVQTGGDVAQMRADLQATFNVSRRRASLIARDQSSKATAAFTRARYIEVGVKQAEWVHSAGGHTQRPTHVRAGKDRQRYDVAQGWWDPAVKKFIWPGTEINCRCVARPVIEGLVTQ